jgi:hypothetical protein
MDQSFRFEYGQTVRIAASAPPPLRPGMDLALIEKALTEHLKSAHNA